MKELYDDVIKTFQELGNKQANAMVICHSFGFNGFKRWHRRRAKKYDNIAIALANELFDNFSKKASFAVMPCLYTAESMKEHLAAWNNCLENTISYFVDISKKFFELTGVINCYIKKALKHLRKDREKIRRWYARFDSANWSVHDMHTVDDKIHAKEKKREGKHAGKNINTY